MKQIVNSIPVFSGDLDAAISRLLDRLTDADSSPCLCVSCTGAHGLVEANENAVFSEVLKSFYLNLPDGMPLVWLAKLKGFSDAGRCYGPNVFASLLAKTASLDTSHFFCGGKPGVAEELAQVATNTWIGVNIAGTHCPPFRVLDEMELQVLADQINRSGASVVWIGLSTPKQEVFASRLAPLLKAKLIITVGAAFDFYTGKVSQAPTWIQRSGLEWFYRLMQEPRRLAPRYLKIVPKFAFMAIRSLLIDRSKKSLL
ncbi:MAG: WecB/TagA/CpsF family glycosyltransferase [Sphingomonadales bacterium]